jgi:hypothetical protein
MRLPEQLELSMSLMCADLKISTPTIKATRKRYGAYYGQTHTINIGSINLENPVMLKQVLAHELAHHVDRLTNDRSLPGRRSHDRIFYRALLLVIDRSYGDRSAYPWKWEYRSLLAWARKDRYTQQCQCQNVMTSCGWSAETPWPSE